MHFAVRTVVALILVSTLGCMGSTSSNVKWSEDIAVYAESKDPKLNDHNIYSAGETSPLLSEAMDEASQQEADKYTQATLEWGQPQTIQRVIVKADPGELEFFEVQYQDEAGDWQTLREVKNHIKDEYKLDLREPIQTRKLRLKVPKEWDSRRMTGQKRRTRGEGGAPVAAFKKIRDIEVYYALPSSEPAVAPSKEQAETM